MVDARADAWLEEATTRLAASGLRAGAARMSVVELFARRGQCLMTAAEAIEHLRGAQSGSAATVYRVIDELSSLGLLHRVDGRDGVARFEIADPAHHHHHLVDDDTGATEPFADPQLEAAIEAAAARLGIVLSDHEVTLRGRRAR